MHEGHRQRMYQKLKSNDNLFDHEILEMLLFNAYSRTNTNPIAHSLLKTFGSLRGVFDADPEQLVMIDGVGENVAMYIKCVGECITRIEGSKGAIRVRNYADFQNLAAKRLRGLREETLELFFLDRNGKLIFNHTQTSGKLHKVEISTDKIMGMIAVVKPFGMFVAHNHLGGISAPSDNDDNFTAELMKICAINNVSFYDHIIYASDSNMYSYQFSGKLELIRKELSAKNRI